MLGYVIENTPFQLDQREKVQEHYTLVKHYFEESILLDEDNAVPMRTGCAIGEPTLHRS